jgi:hypothetical protein
MGQGGGNDQNTPEMSDRIAFQPSTYQHVTSTGSKSNPLGLSPRNAPIFDMEIPGTEFRRTLEVH